MSLTPELWARAEAMLAADTGNFVRLVEIAGLDRSKAFRHGDLRKCQLQDQDLGGFDFSGADFAGANVTRTVFTGANLKGADLSKVTGFAEAILDGAECDDRTIWPDDDWRFPDWADVAGQDEFGLWAGFSVVAMDGSRVTQRLRWIPPGAFVMGSPDTEEGRYDDEGPLTPITFADGFWLFDTPCTQALWMAVLGRTTPAESIEASRLADDESYGDGLRRFLLRLNPFRRARVVPPLRPDTRDGVNPSLFQSPDRPVERVSFDDARRFVRRLNGLKPGLAMTLPSEAQWEYACRAGTTAASYAGPVAILGQHNAPVLDAIAWYRGNCGQEFELDNGYDISGSAEKQYQDTRGGTHPVALKQPNAWGLHDMLGNVWEWCVDEWHNTHVDVPLDGRARDSGGGGAAGRVVRGGSWDGRARNVRAACRSRIVPSRRDGNIGFRCARGRLA